MAATARKVLEVAMHLSPKARLDVAARLIASVVAPGTPVDRRTRDAAWSKELDRRWSEAERADDWGEPHRAAAPRRRITR